MKTLVLSSKINNFSVWVWFRWYTKSSYVIFYCLLGAYEIWYLLFASKRNWKACLDSADMNGQKHVANRAVVFSSTGRKCNSRYTEQSTWLIQTLTELLWNVTLVRQHLGTLHCEGTKTEKSSSLLHPPPGGCHDGDGFSEHRRLFQYSKIPT